MLHAFTKRDMNVLEKDSHRSFSAERWSALKTALAIIALAAVYFTASKFGFTLAFAAEQVSIVWPPTGIALAAVLLLGYRIWPAIALGAFLANVTAHESVITALGIAAGNTLEALSGAWLLRRLTYCTPGLTRLRDAAAFIFFCAFIGTMVSATIGVISLCLGGVQPWQSFGTLWLVWWLGDAGGALIVAPFLLVWLSRSCHVSAVTLIEAAILAAGLTVTSAGTLIGGPIMLIDGYAPIFTTLLFIIWAALRFDQHGTTFVTLVSLSAALWATINGVGPFSKGDMAHDLMLLQIFMMSVAITGLLLGGAVSEYKEAEKARNLLAAIIQSSDEAIISKTLGGIITSWNTGAEKLLGYTENEALGRHVDFIVPPDRQEEEKEIIRKLSTGEKIGHLETVRIAKNRNKIDVFLSLSPIHDSPGNVIGASTVVRDITERKRSEEKLQLAMAQSQLYQAKLENILDNLFDGLITMDENGTVESYNKACERIFGYRPEEVIGKNIKMLMPGHYDTRQDQSIQNFTQTGADGTGREVEGMRKNGMIFPMELSVAQVRQGGKNLFIGIVRDITDKKTAERKLKAANRYLKDMMDHIPDPIFMKDRDHRWIGGNKAFWEMMGGPPEKFIGKSDYEFFPAAEAAVFWEKDDMVFTSGDVNINEEFFTDAQGMRHVLSTKKTAFLNENDEQFLVGVIRDITVIKQAEEDRVRYTEALERSNQELDDFAYIVSHDLKEPLRGISTMAGFLLEDYENKLDPEGVKNIKRIEYLSRRIDRMVGDLLFFSRLGHTELAVQDVDPNQVIDDIRNTMDDFIKQRNGKITIPHPMPHIICDKPRITEVFRNLITNALKYNDKPQPMVEIGFLAEVDAPQGHEDNVFYVRDNGIGIEPRFHKDIFRIFKRLPNSGIAEDSGTGMGLSFVQTIVERYNGHVWLESMPGTGSTFYFSFGPLAKIPPKKEKIAA
jgi:two-component system sensor kinase FixL